MAEYSSPTPYRPYHRAVATPDGVTDPDDILVVIGHPFGDIEVPLAVWIAAGPGPRPLVRPIRHDHALPANPCRCRSFRCATATTSSPAKPYRMAYSRVGSTRRMFDACSVLVTWLFGGR